MLYHGSVPRRDAQGWWFLMPFWTGAASYVLVEEYGSIKLALRLQISVNPMPRNYLLLWWGRRIYSTLWGQHVEEKGDDVGGVADAVTPRTGMVLLLAGYM